MQTEEDIAARARQILDEGASIIDIGAYSSQMCIRDRYGSDDTFHLCHQFFGNRTFGTSFCFG